MDSAIMFTRIVAAGGLLLAGCSALDQGLSQNTSIPPLSVEEVMDAQVELATLTGDIAIAYQLQDGVYQKGTDPAGASYVSIRLLEQMAFGDLNGDSAGDAVALVAENYGGTGTFVSVAAFVNEKGRPVQAAILPIDDRPLIQSLIFEDGLIGLDVTIHGLQDPMCCPSFQTKRHYQLHKSQLVLRDFSSETVSGQWRVISINSPENVRAGAEPAQISGTVSIAPFENNLSYYIIDPLGNELAAGPVPVTAMDMGAPGTFQVEVPLEHVPPGTTAWIEIRDTSPADGSLLAMDSIEIR